MKGQIIALNGEPLTMKTSYALTFPGKIAYYDWDQGVERGYQFASLESEGKVVVRDLHRPIRSMFERYAMLKGYYEAWEFFVKDFLEMLESPEFETIVIDTGTMLWRLCCDAVLQTLQTDSYAKSNGQSFRRQLLQIEYGLPNQWMKQIFDMVKPAGKNLIVVHHMSREYAPLMQPDGKTPIMDENGQPRSFETGGTVADGWKYTMSKCDWIFECSTSRDEKGLLQGKAKITKPGGNIQLEGMEIPWFTYDKFNKLREQFA